MGLTLIKRTITAALVASVILPAAAMAAGTTGATFLNVNVSAKEEAMGGAYSAVADDASAVTINPAGIVQVKGNQVALMHNEYFADINQEYISYVQSSGAKAYGANLVYMDYGSQTGTTASNTVTGFFTPKSFAFSVAYAMRASEELSYGVALKYIKTEIATYDDSTFALDAGILYKPAGTGFTGAIVLSNLGAGLELYQNADPLPIKLKLGGAYQFDDMPLLATTDLYFIKDEDTEYHIGLQYTISEIVPVRLGYTNQTEDIANGFSFGIGLIQPEFSIDYAFIPTDNLDDSHRLSVLFNF